jgi:hypothetical protein
MKPLQNWKNSLFLTVLLLIGFATFLQAASISGIITNETALPLNHSDVQLVKLNGNSNHGDIFRTTFSNPAGSYIFPNLPTGEYYVYACAPEYERGFYAEPETGEILVVEVDADDQEVIGINIQLLPDNDPPPPPPPVHGSILGTVFGNGNVPLAGKHVGIIPMDSLNAPIPGWIIHTNHMGSYMFHNVLAGTYQTCVMGPDNQPVAFSQEVIVTEGALVDSVDIFLNEDPPPPPPLFGSISGNVIGGEGNNEDDDDYENYTIGIVSVNDLTTPIPGITGHTNCQGHYFLHHIPAGVYKTCILDQNNLPIAYSEEVTVVGNDFLEDVNIVMGTLINYSISGTVLNALNLPPQHGIVELRTAPDSTNTNNGHHNHRTVHLNQNGEYTFSNIPAGIYILSVWVHMSPVVFYPSTYDIEQTVPISVVDQNLTGMNIVLPADQTFSISGYVLDAITDAPLAGILVKTDRMGFHHFPIQDSLFTNEYTAITDAAGYYNIVAPYGRYTVGAIDTLNVYHHQFYNHATNPFHASVIMLNHDYTNINFDLIPVQDSLNFSISGTVTEDGEAVTYPVMVVAVSSDEDWEDSAVTGPGGVYTINNLQPGNYYVVAYSLYTPPSFYNNALSWEDAEQIDVNGDITGINFNLINQEADGPCNVDGVISASNGSGLENVVVMLTNSQNQVIGFARTNELGQYSINNVPGETYTVIATKIGLTTVTQDLYVTGNENLNLVLQSPTANEDAYVPITATRISNYPNPFNPMTNISFSLSKDSKVNVQIYNIKGQSIKSLLSNNLKSGSHSLKWDGTDNEGKQVTSGIYLIKLQGEGFQKSHKITLMK